MKSAKMDKKMITGYLLSIVLFAIVLGLFGAGILFFSNKADREGTETLKRAITRASVQCYSIEGRYPPSVDYLAENYGIQIDEERYHVFYNGFASNIMPEITVVQAEE